MDLPLSSPAKCSLKRKRKQEFSVDFLGDVVTQVSILNSSLSSSQSDRLAAKRAVDVLFAVGHNEAILNSMVDCGAVPALLKYLEAPEPVREGDGVPKPYEHEVEKGCLLVLESLAFKPEHQQLIVDAGALSYLMDLLKSYKTCGNSRALTGLIRRAAYLIASLVQENDSIQTRVRMEGGIPPLVELLEFDNVKVQRAAAEALRSLAFKNDENKNQIVRCNALPTLVLMLGSEDAAIRFEAVSFVGWLVRNLVNSSPHIRREVLLAGALRPIIGLLRSDWPESQREAALLIGIFAGTDSDCKAHIAQRGAIQPLIDMLKSPDEQLWKASAFALGRLAQDAHNQAGIAYNGGLELLLNLLCSKDGPLQRNAAFALYGFADNEENVADIVKVGGVQKLQDGDFIDGPAKEYVGKTMKRLEEKMHGQVLKQLIYLMRFGEKVVQRRVALALAHLCAPDDGKFIFVDNNGLKSLLDLLESTNIKQNREASMALHSLAVRTTSISPSDATPPSSTSQVYLGEQYINNPTFSDIIFLVEGKEFYAHRICLLASSDAFRAMLDGFYWEKEAKEIQIPNVKWDVFEVMMRFIYTRNVDVNLDIAQDLLRVYDQYLLDGLKRSCECALAQDISVENVSLIYELSESFNAMALRHACIFFLLAQYDKLSAEPWYRYLICRIVPDIRELFGSLLTKPTSGILDKSPS
ncbi:ARM REPEAT PROTEIN INTERACTING WITH ABF2-like [Neltuma alba]|uniref:ARM REPEAT PROTEIN INTERACTING WITH ABF2-like n=1 Tax=Neltuma alba TaxID=207710 RepID=UPI0010A5602C|nr:ARM REPEAT PROTEIN INTERACTING WITH ABF2-like [Prosopis alba]